jgi:hypothetical protein
MKRIIFISVFALLLSTLTLAQNTATDTQNAANSATTSEQPSPNPPAQSQTTTTPSDQNAQPNDVQQNSNTLPNPNGDAVNGNNAAPQQSEPALGARNTSTGPNTIMAGTEIKAALDDALTTKTAHTGQEFTATVINPVQDSSGANAIPTGSKIVGNVTTADEGGRIIPAIQGKAKLALRFREVQLPNGTTFPITASLVSVNSTNKNASTKTNDEGEITSGRTGKRTATDIGIGAGIGTVAGLIFGSALKGLAIGALAGGGYVLATGGREVELPAQTGLMIRLDQNATVSPQNAPTAPNAPTPPQPPSGPSM